MENIKRKSYVHNKERKRNFIFNLEVYFCGCYFCSLFKKKEEEKRKLYVFFSLNARNRIEMNHT